MDWKEEYKKKLVSAEDAVKAVKSGDYVVFAQPEAPALGLALVSLAGDISGVRIMGGGGSDLRGVLSGRILDHAGERA